MNQLFESYKILKVGAGVPFSEVTSAYKAICSEYLLEVTGDPESAARMRDINAAYCYLRDKRNHTLRLKEKLSANKSVLQKVWHGEVSVSFGRGGIAKQASFSVLRAYLKAIMSGELESAYSYLCNYNKQFITRAAFVKWRKGAGKNSSVREFAIEEKPTGATVTLKNGRGFPARKYRVNITERNAAAKENRHRREEMLVINENGRWYVLLGENDLKVVSKISDDLRESAEKHKAPKPVEKLMKTMSQEPDITDFDGLQKELKKEQYRQRRYGGFFTIGVFAVVNNAGDVSDAVMFTATAELKKSLRETDVPAFVGGTSFAVLFVGLKKKNAEQIMRRIADKITGSVEKVTNININIECETRISLNPGEFGGS